MKKRVSFVSIILACVFAFALAGCSGGGSQSVSEDQLKGAWRLEDPASVGFDAFLQFDDESMATYAVADSWIDGEWAVESGAATAKFADQQVKLSLSGDKLTLGSADGSKLVFKRGAEGETLESFMGFDGGVEGAEGAEEVEVVEEVINDIEPVTIADDDVVSITVTGKGTDFTADPGYRLSIENKSKEAIFIAAADVFKVDGKDINAGVGEIIDPGQTVEAFVYFPKDELGGSVEALKNVSGELYVMADETSEELGTYAFNMDQES